MNLSVLISFAVYLACLLALGLRFWSSGRTTEGYLLGHRSLGRWVTAFSAEASDMSGWLLMALPGTVYLNGPSEIWIAVGLLIGTYLNWRLVAARLRVYTAQTRTLTMPAFFKERFGDPTGLLQWLSAAIILIFFTIYTSSGMVSTGKLLESVFGLPYRWAVLAGGGVVVAYTFIGGYLAVCWTDMFQGLLMVVPLAIIPVAAMGKGLEFGDIASAMSAKGIHTGIVPNSPLPVLAICSSAAWGLGYFGQPHILARFMSVRSLEELRWSLRIAMVWVGISLSAAVAIGLIAIAMFDGLADGQQEKVTIYMIQMLAWPWLQGVLLAAILAAIMSTIDSQLLVAASSLTEDLYRRLAGREIDQRQMGLASRLSVICISAIAIILAMPRDSLILRTVAYAWAGFGGAFGPVVLFALFSRRTTWVAALAGMATGAVTVVIWRQVGLGTYMYEIVPAFAANCAAMLLVNAFGPQADQRILQQYHQVMRAISATDRSDLQPPPDQV